MIATELERTVAAYIAATTGTLVAESDDPLVNSGGLSFEVMPQGMANYAPAPDGGLANIDTLDGVPVDGGLAFRLYLGQANTDIRLPCAIISAQEGTEDFDTGNEEVQLTVAIHAPAQAYGTETDPAAKLLEISEAIINLLRRDDLADYLNLYRPDPERFSAIGTVDRSTAKSVDGSKWIHQIQLTLYCAACDVAGTGLVTPGFAPPQITTTQRNLLTGSSPVVIFNTTTGTYQGRTGEATWEDLTTG